MTLFLASQTMQFPDPAATASGVEQDPQAMRTINWLSEYLRGNSDESLLSSLSGISPQFSDFCRISENATIAGSHQGLPKSVIFSVSNLHSLSLVSIRNQFMASRPLRSSSLSILLKRECCWSSKSPVLASWLRKKEDHRCPEDNLPLEIAKKSAALLQSPLSTSQKT